MRSLLPLSFMLVAVGCLGQPDSISRDVPSDVQTGSKVISYAVLSSPPDAILGEMELSYSVDRHQWQKDWNEDNSSITVDGQRVLYLLEVACYADIVCHRIEYPLRRATMEYVKENLNSSGVVDVLQWILTSYRSGLPEDVPWDATGEFKGTIVHAMNDRLVYYANEILRPSDRKDISN